MHPRSTPSIDVEAGTVTYHDAEHLGIAVDTERGLLVPVIHDAGDLNLAGLAQRIADLAERTRTNKISPGRAVRRHVHADQHRQPGRAVRHADHQPAAGRASWAPARWSSAPWSSTTRTWARSIAPRSMVYLALSYDHRLVDGADAARFLTTVKERLEAGNFEAELGL